MPTSWNDTQRDKQLTQGHSRVSDQVGVWTQAVWLQSPTDKFTIQHLRKKLSKQKILSTEEV